MSIVFRVRFLDLLSLIKKFYHFVTVTLSHKILFLFFFLSEFFIFYFYFSRHNILFN